MSKNYYFAALIAFVATGIMSCTQMKKESTKHDTSSCQVETQNFCEEYNLVSTYRGTFPCADCGGKDMRLTISEDGTYSLAYKYQDREERIIEENGVYRVFDDGLVVTITPSSGEKTYYKFIDGNLILTDSLGTENEGELAELYILKRDK